ncbi:MAG: hypothetical protein JOZ73_00765 [Solirubrobacterales bacterium]|nr:hypothetical protein [Solirubrobacterales bacterium]
MRMRIAVLASALCALAAVVPSGVSAAPTHRLTINAVPNPINAGDGVLIYGQLSGPHRANRSIRLFQRLTVPGQHYQLVGRAKTDSSGLYEFVRADVTTNRNWFVAGPAGSHSRKVHERVHALVSINASNISPDTRHAVVFTGHVTPNHAGERVFLQEQKGTSDDWRTLKSDRLNAGSNYSIKYRWSTPGERDVRVVFRGDRRNIRSTSDTVTITVQQTQVPGFTINTNSPIISEGGSATISGVLDKAGTTTPEPNTNVTLYAKPVGQSNYVAVGSTNTGTDGHYQFTVSPNSNTLYEAKVTFTPSRHSAVLFEGVRDVVSMGASASSVKVGTKVTFSGVVNPNKAGHRIYLQLLGKDKEWHAVAVTLVRSNATFQFVWKITERGTHKFRARIFSDKQNVGAASAPVSVTGVGLAPAPITSAP